MSAPPDFAPTPGADERATPVRVLFVQGDERPAVDVQDEPVVMTFPHLLVREMVAFLGLSLVLVFAAIFVDAPLEELASPERTPNPAKAPWYFLGLQELLHYYPPIVSGVLLPGLLVGLLVVIPYFHVNVVRAPLWTHKPGRTLVSLAAAVVALTLLFGLTGAHAVWPIIGPLWIVAALVAIGAPLHERGRIGAWLSTRSLPFWIFLWFLLSALALTIVGVFFRGPGWSFTLPWRDGIFG